MCLSTSTFCPVRAVNRSNFALIRSTSAFSASADSSRESCSRSCFLLVENSMPPLRSRRGFWNRVTLDVSSFESEVCPCREFSGPVATACSPAIVSLMSSLSGRLRIYFCLLAGRNETTGDEATSVSIMLQIKQYYMGFLRVNKTR